MSRSHRPSVRGKRYAVSSVHYLATMARILRSVPPASPDAWLTALARYGSMTFEEVVEPALDLAENGHPAPHNNAVLDNDG